MRNAFLPYSIEKAFLFLSKLCVDVCHLHPHLSVFDIILDRIQNFLCIGDSQNLEVYITELDEIEGVVLPGDKDSAVVE